jgi:hypothetical protein
VILPRLHFFELDDQPSFPVLLRDLEQSSESVFAIGRRRQKQIERSVRVRESPSYRSALIAKKRSVALNAQRPTPNAQRPTPNKENQVKPDKTKTHFEFELARKSPNG